MQTIFSPNSNSSGARVLGLGAHPDDLEVGAGGLLSRLVRQGAEVKMVVCSVPTLLEERVQEARKGAEVIGAELVLLNPERACRVEDIPMHDLVRRLDQIIAEFSPTLVVTHSGKDLHWDHGLVNRATVSALRRTPCDLFAYVCSPEMNSLARMIGECFVDISTTLDTKIAAIEAHASQVPKICVQSARDLARAIGRLSGLPYAEAYEVMRLRI